MQPPEHEFIENWSQFRLQLLWAYKGAATDYRSCILPATPIAAWLLLKGHVLHTCDGQTTRYDAGSWVFPCGREGWQEFSEDAEILSIRFLAEWPTGESLYDRSRTIAFPATEETELTSIGMRLAKLTQRNFMNVGLGLRRVRSTPQHYFEMQRLLYDWMRLFSRAMERRSLLPNIRASMNERVREAVYLIENLPLNQPFTESELASRISLSVSQLNRLFMQETGMTPYAYWDEKRVIAARTALRDSKKSIKSIAYGLGFGSLPHFSKWIKKKLGYPPRQVRDTARLRAEP